MGTRTSLRQGNLTAVEKNLIAQVALDQPGPVRPAQITALAKALRRSKETVKSAMEDVQDTFRANAEFYVNAHKQTVQNALDDGDPKALAVAASATQWAIERLSAEGVRIIEKAAAESGQGGPRVLIGIRVGGLDATKQQAIDVTATEVK